MLAKGEMGRDCLNLALVHFLMGEMMRFGQVCFHWGLGVEKGDYQPCGV